MRATQPSGGKIDQLTRVAGMEISAAGIKPVAGNLSTLVKAPDIQNITIRYGFRSHHPIIQIIFGGALSVLLIDTLQTVYNWLTHGGVLFESVLFLLVPGGLGVWLIIDAFQADRRVLRRAETEEIYGPRRCGGMMLASPLDAPMSMVDEDDDKETSYDNNRSS